MDTPTSTPQASLPASPQPGRPERSPERASTWAGTLFKGVVNLVTILLIVFLTYHFTVFFATPKPTGWFSTALSTLTYHFTVFFGAPVPVARSSSADADQALVKKAEDLRAQEKKVMSSYGWANPATKSVRIPVERAMELIAAESAQPVATAAPAAPNVVPTPAPSPVVAKAGDPKGVPVVPGTPTKPVTTPAPAAPAGGSPTTITTVAAPTAPAPVGMAPDRIYFMLCATCHEADGRGTIARKTMKDADKIPDLTDPTWQGSRTDADLEHSILEGKGTIMLARKDILTNAHTDVKEMVALMRSFRGGKQTVTATGTAQPFRAQPDKVATGPGRAAPVLSPPAAPGTPVPEPTPRVPGPTNGEKTVIGSGSSGPAPPPPGPPPGTPGPEIPAIPVSTAVSPERAAKLRAASEFYRTNCFACHGLDGTGNLVRPLMPTIPNFTTREWQTSRSNTQLVTTILEGKGTNMPPWRGKFTNEFAKDLISYVRTIGPADLLTAGLTKTAVATNFENQIRDLKMQWDEVEKQLRELNLPPAKP